ncbi:flagellar basal body-associated FliL family protein [Desulfoluna sp.]|uniref:flagellar basal body-associated FliL family protein n=1 Tax=Desulfoluna sp. TaxID=2045199 RepID=UPI002610BAE5|nr:flagellar basal body-associated FliL family protein [Desulfoluna sp.]
MPGFLKNKKKRLIILIGILVLALAGAGAAWLFYSQPGDEVEDAVVEASPPLHKASFQALWPLAGVNVPLSGRMGDRTLRLSFSFVLDSETLKGELEIRREEILEALALSLSGRSVEEMERIGSKVRLKYETLRLVNGLLAGGGVKGVFVTEFFIL